MTRRLQDHLDGLLAEYDLPGQAVAVRSEQDASAVTLIPGLRHAPPPDDHAEGDSSWFRGVRRSACTAWVFTLGIILDQDQGNY
ncbi:hypothetical protein A6A08_16535 [Nocardiopsis sp. TSRI0078]|uniref:hypothetical protein n=1 Tax=unclassified Nocardiopsis TaxID=2649073 RepID=UPI00093E0B3C|nr:hypothetical protein [Nocardiopsis sp. TSRI0078]OKI13044.1 hypothetical protein A6A08_16535 [Nocardiopsis sp. TSRI0078]